MLFDILFIDEDGNVYRNPISQENKDAARDFVEEQYKGMRGEGMICPVCEGSELLEPVPFRSEKGEHDGDAA